MSIGLRTSRAAVWIFLVGLLSCSTGSSGGAAGGLELLSINFLPGQTLAVNLPIEFEFNKPIDLSSATLSTVLIEPLPESGQGFTPPVQGEFFLRGRHLIFQPLCPDSSNAAWGFQPGSESGSIQYQITLLGAGDATDNLLRAEDRSTLDRSVTFLFQTPSPPTSLWKDPVPGPPQVRDAESLPETVGLNLFSRPNEPLDIILDQPVVPESIDAQSILVSFEDPTLGTVSLPVETALTKNCTASGESVLTLLMQGILPPGRDLQFHLSDNVQGLGGSNDRNVEDRLFLTAGVLDASRPIQLDAILETFDGQERMNPQPAILTPLARWQDGNLQAAPIFSGPMSGVEIEIGPGTTNGEVVSFDTNGTTLKDVNGNVYYFAGGIVEVGRFTLKNPQGKNSRLEIVGPNSFILRAAQSVFIGSGASILATGADGPSLNGIGSLAGTPSQGGPGRAGGGDGGNGSPLTTQSSAVGGDGFGAYQIPAGGGKGGHSAFGWTSNKSTKPAGGGGGNAGVMEINADGRWVAYCWGRKRWSEGCVGNNSNGCTDGDPNNSLGEAGAGGAQSNTSPYCTIQGSEITQYDAVDGTCWSKGGAAGPAIYVDGDPENDFAGRKARLDPSGNVEIFQGELTACLPGQGGGGGGDNVAEFEFPSYRFPTVDYRGSGGGGGGGFLQIESLGKITIRGSIHVNGGQGGEAQVTFNNETITSGGGGGSGGTIILESGVGIEIDTNAELRAMGGNRGIGGGTLPGWSNGVGCLYGVRNETSSKGGAGGKGTIILRLPHQEGSNISCGGVAQPAIVNGGLVVDDVTILCERDLTPAGNRSKNIQKRFDPAPHILLPTFGSNSGAQSEWYYLGWSSLIGPTDFAFDGSDPATGIVDAGFTKVLAAGLGGSVDADGFTITLDDPDLANLIRSEPRSLRGNGFRQDTGDFIHTITGAAIAGDRVTLNLDGNGNSIEEITSWEILDRYASVLLNGLPVSSLPSSSEVRVFFQGADPLFPGSIEPDPASITPETSEIKVLKSGGFQLLRFRIELEANAQGNPVGQVFDLPGLDFLRIRTSF